jgi:hypothetical protein
MPWYEFTAECQECGISAFVMKAEAVGGGLFCGPDAPRRDQPIGWITGKLMDKANIPKGGPHNFFYIVCPECGCQIELSNTASMHARIIDAVLEA